MKYLITALLIAFSVPAFADVHEEYRYHRAHYHHAYYRHHHPYYRHHYWHHYPHYRHHHAYR